MPDKIEISTKLIALLTAIIVLISAVLTFRKKKDSDQTTLQNAQNTKRPEIWNLVMNLIGVIAFFIVLFGGLKLVEIIQSYKPK